MTRSTGKTPTVSSINTCIFVPNTFHPSILKCFLLQRLIWFPPSLGFSGTPFTTLVLCSADNNRVAFCVTENICVDGMLVACRDWGWRIFEAIIEQCKTPTSYSGIKDVGVKNNANGRNYDDAMQSFLMAGT